MTIPLTEHERETLPHLYRDGAWTTQEAQEYLGDERTDELVNAGIITTTLTEIGTLYLLGAAGRTALFGRTPSPLSISTLTNRAYLRLCAQDYGWTPADLNLVPIDLTQYDRSKRGVMYVTGTGLTFAFGNITHPLSRQFLQKLDDRYRALALAHRITLSIFTNHKIRGQQFSSRRSYLNVIHHLPNMEHDSPQRIIHITPEWAEESELITTSQGPAITELEMQNLIAKGVPEQTAHVLTLPLHERIEQALTDLQTDGAISYPQLRRHYRLEPGDLIGTTLAQELIRPVHGQRTLEVPVTFICADSKTAVMDGTRLGHRAGTAELRQLLGAPTNEWVVESRNTHRSEEPDAYWRKGEQLTAIEYDTGSYDATTITFKVHKFREKGATEIVWGVAGKKRVANLQAKFGLDTRLCEWWKH